MSTIEWTDETWNPIAGCTMVSPGCTNCYAMRMAARLDAMGVGKYRGLTRQSGGRPVWMGKIRLDREAMQIPLRWRRPRKVFVNSMSDLFHEKVPFRSIRSIWEVMALAPQHTFQILTKRAERMQALSWQLPALDNVWLGVSVENQDYVERIDWLRKARARTRFISFEPLIGSIVGLDLVGIDWAIVGGESGPGNRKIDASWVAEIMSACRISGTAFFFKQWGGSNKKATGRKLLGRTWDEYPGGVEPRAI